LAPLVAELLELARACDYERLSVASWSEPIDHVGVAALAVPSSLGRVIEVRPSVKMARHIGGDCTLFAVSNQRGCRVEVFVGELAWQRRELVGHVALLVEVESEGYVDGIETVSRREVEERGTAPETQRAQRR
jgi:hypothetical protein